MMSEHNIFGKERVKTFYHICFFGLLFLTFLFSCKKAREVKADFNLLVSIHKERSAQLRTINAQEIDREDREHIIAKELDYQLEGSRLHLTLHGSGAEFMFNPEMAGLPGSWKRFSHLKVSLENNTDHDIEITVVLWAPRGRLPDTINVSANNLVSKLIDLHDLPLIGSVDEKYKTSEIALHFDNYKEGSAVSVHSISLIQPDRDKDFAVVDRFGQRKSTQWPVKIESEGEFEEHLEKEKGVLSNSFEAEIYDAYLGMKTGKTYKSTGYFSLGKTEKDGIDTWFFITPEGNPFWSFGVTCIRSKKPRHSMTLIKGNEQLFDELPARDGPYGDAYIDSTFSFYNMNILKKYGDLQPWRDAAFSRLRSWGLNTIGNWAEDSIVLQSNMPFTFSFETNVNAWEKDIYDPEWLSYVDSVLAGAERFKQDPYLLGYFVDNEARWGNLRLLQTLPENAHLRHAWKNRLQKKYKTLQALNKVNERSFASWSEVMNSREEIAFSREDLIMLEELYASKYFKTISDLLKKHDPNHLYLGCRFTRKLKPEHILKTAGTYCDVITVNVYSYEPVKEQMDAWYMLTGRPILIGEHQAALKSPRQLPLRWQVFDKEERYAYFTNYVEKWARMPYSLGSHWYQFSDQHITGRASNGENQIIGFVDITDQPYEEMIEAARYNSARIYQWHGVINE